MNKWYALYVRNCIVKGIAISEICDKLRTREVFKVGCRNQVSFAKLWYKELKGIV
jgi:hypothetical protein